jgi:hypothetical protein
MQHHLSDLDKRSRDKCDSTQFTLDQVIMKFGFEFDPEKNSVLSLMDRGGGGVNFRVPRKELALTEDVQSVETLGSEPTSFQPNLAVGTDLRVIFGHDTVIVSGKDRLFWKLCRHRRSTG